jgi:hypothetical protein
MLSLHYYGLCTKQQDGKPALLKQVFVDLFLFIPEQTVLYPS